MMDKKKKIKEIAKILGWLDMDDAVCKNVSIMKPNLCKKCKYYKYKKLNNGWSCQNNFEAEALVNAGYGDLRRFAERLKADVSEDNELHEALNYYLKRDYFEYIDETLNEF